MTGTLAEMQRQAEGWESFVVEEREGFQLALIGGCWPQEAAGRPLEAGHPLSSIRGACLAFWASLVAQMAKNLPAVWETWVRALSWEDPLEKGMATLSSILAWRIQRTVEFVGSQRVGHD